MQARLARLNSEVRQVPGQEAVRSRLLVIGCEPAGGTAAKFPARIETDIRKWRDLARTAKLDG